MPGDVERNGRNVADGEAVSVSEQAVELGAVAAELGSFVEYLAEHLLNDGNAGTDSQRPAKLFLQIGRGGQMVRVRVRFEQPVDRQRLPLDESDDVVGGPRRSTPSFLVKIQNAVDDRGPARGRIGDDMGRREGRLVEESRYFRPRSVAVGRAAHLLGGYGERLVCTHVSVLLVRACESQSLRHR